MAIEERSQRQPEHGEAPQHTCLARFGVSVALSGSLGDSIGLLKLAEVIKDEFRESEMVRLSRMFLQTYRVSSLVIPRSSMTLLNRSRLRSRRVAAIILLFLRCRRYDPPLPSMSPLSSSSSFNVADLNLSISFSFGGFWGALIIKVGFVLRNIYFKKSLQSFKEVNGLNLYGWISILSFFYLFPVAVYVEGAQWVQGYQQAIGTVGNPMTLYFWVMLSGVFYHLHNQSSYQALDEISPLTFSVGNTMKRVVVIISTVFLFRNPGKPLNALGSLIAILGTFVYSQANAAQTSKNNKVIEGGENSS